MYEMRTGRSRHQMRQNVAVAVAAGEVQVETMSKEAARGGAAGEVKVETRAPSSERQVWHHGAAALLDRSHPFSTPAKPGYTARRRFF